MSAFTPLQRVSCAVIASALGCAAHANAPHTSATVGVDGWRIDRTEVSVAQFANYARATGVVTRAEQEGGGFEYAGGWQRRAGWTWRTPYGQVNGQTDTDVDANALLPAVHLSFSEAQAYCNWAGGQLPSYQQWATAAYSEQREQATDGFVRGTTYPYPTGLSGDGANTSAPDAWPKAAPVGATKRGVNGLFDMGANVWEWTATAQGDSRQTAGGSWWYGAYQMRADVNAFKDKDFYAVYIGFRCVYTNPQ